ncbi:hypothetical protein P154DRAFT_517122 [Amniculicola lignicola CBS 123094]|uniref:C2H2-type domain-containing protein n=1 Tax=Amniculicola lignicola CBS 123094 TaxID=1392246 RepID=A0A6A5X390_9PLEO|nr:hypothetical protein P154DRAFT_517122 [Amniculicola lignicola CBS 123094]
MSGVPKSRSAGASAPPPPRIAALSTSSPDGDNFGCPFARRYDPDGDNGHCCIHRAYITVHRVKEHLIRSHSPVCTCPRCHTTFKERKDLDTHLTLPDDLICVIQPPPGKAEVAFLTDSQLREVKKKRSCRVSDRAEWDRIYVLLFPDHIDKPSPYVPIKPLVLPHGFKEDLATELSSLVAVKLEADPTYASIQPAVFRNIINKELVDEAFKRVQATPSLRKRRRLPVDETENDTEKPTKQKRSRISNTRTVPPTSDDTRPNARNSPLCTPEPLRRPHPPVPNDIAPEASQHAHVCESDLEEVTYIYKPYITPKTPSQSFSMSTRDELWSQSSFQSQQLPDSNITSFSSQHMPPSQCDKDLLHDISSDCQPDTLSSFTQPSWDSGFGSIYAGPAGWSFDAQGLLVLENSESSQPVGQTVVNGPMPLAEETQDWSMLPITNVCPSSPSPGGRGLEDPSGAVLR